MKEFLFRKARLNIAAFIIALVMVGLGIGIFLVSGTTNREDIRLYNQAIAIYNREDYISATDTSSVSFTTDNLLLAVDYFQQAADISTDNELKSLAYYNMGTALARDYRVFSGERLSEYGLSDAISFLREAIRLDPLNEDAKYNLEYLERYGE